MRGDVTTLVQLLESPSIDINQLDDESMSALHWASAYGETKIIEILLRDHRINPNVTNKRGSTPLHVAVTMGSIPSVRTLLKDERIKQSIDRRNNWGETALILSATRGDPHIAFILLEKGSNREAKDNWNHTAHEVAHDHGETFATHLLHHERLR